MDYLRNGYDTFMRMSLDPAIPPVRVTWYRAAPGARIFRKPHCFGSTIWEADAREYPASGLGEIDLLRRKPTFIRHKDNGQGPLGTPEAWFTKGVPSGFVPKTCCGRPFDRGIGERGGPSLWGWFSDPRDERNLGVRELSRPSVRVLDWESSVAELAGPSVNPLDLVGERVGPGVEFEPRRIGSNELVGPGVEFSPPRRGVGELVGPSMAQLVSVALELACPSVNPLDLVGEVDGPGVAEISAAAELAGPSVNPLDLVGEAAGPSVQHVPPREGVGELVAGEPFVPPDDLVGELVAPQGVELTAAPPTLFNSGVDEEGSKLNDLDPDPHWTVRVASYLAAALTQRHDYVFLPDAISTLSSWISHDADWHADPDSFRYYETTFEVVDLVGLVGTYLGGRICVDDQTFQVRVNGAAHPLSVSGPGFQGFAFAADDLVVGSNTISFLCLSSDSARPTNEEGFRVEWYR